GDLITAVVHVSYILYDRAEAGGLGNVHGQQQVGGVFMVVVQLTGDPVVEEGEVEADVCLGRLFPFQVLVAELGGAKASQPGIVREAVERKIAEVADLSITGQAIVGAQLKEAEGAAFLEEIFFRQDPANTGGRVPAVLVIGGEAG